MSIKSNTPKIPIGSHLITPRTGYSHHGIYIGKNSVIHYSGKCNNLPAGQIEITTLDKFLDGNSLTIREHKNKKYTGVTVANRARSRVGEGSYDIHANNCEHFCMWAITGRPISKQVDIAEDFVDTLIPFIGTASKLRKHIKSHKLDARGATVDAADTAIRIATPIVFPAVIPVVVAVKIVKWLIK